MQCQIRGMGEASESTRTPHDTLPRSGRVNEVCREWLVHEDGALAYRLQKEEVDQHLSGNKTRNAVVRQDTPIAKWEQRREEEEAVSRQIEERMVQEALDSSVAQKLAERLERDEERKRQARLHRDAEIARRLYEREYTERRAAAAAGPVPMAAAAGPVAGPANFVGLPSPPEFQMRHLELSRPVRSASPYDAPADDDEEEARRLQEEKDAALARQLQEEEEGVPDRLLAIEAQDEELARMLQEKEKAKLRRAKERARQKAFLKKQQQLQRSPQHQNEEDEENCYSLPHSPPEAPDAPPVRSAPSKVNKSRFPDPEEIEDILPRGDIGGGAPAPGPAPAALSPVSPSVDSARNIAAVIDPTYPRKHCEPRELQPALAMPTAAAGLVLPISPSTPPSMMAGLPGLPGLPGLVDLDSTPTPPYMPVQGQRRISSLEKKKKSKSKDACRQQ